MKNPLELIKTKLLEKTSYQGNKEPNRKEISASEFGSDILQIFYRQKYGVIEQDDFQQTSLGSLVHIAIQNILDSDFKSEVSLAKKFENGWSLTGSIDLMNDDWIIDIKVTKQYTIEKVLSEPMHQYRWQLAVYKYLVKEILGKDLKTGILFILKDGGYDFRKNIEIPSIDFIELSVPSYEQVEKRFFEIIDRVNSLDSLDLKTIHCDDLWWRKSKGKSEPIRCKKYCSYNKVCEWYKNYKKNPMQIDNVDF